MQIETNIAYFLTLKTNWQPILVTTSVETCHLSALSWKSVQRRMRVTYGTRFAHCWELQPHVCKYVRTLIKKVYEAKSLLSNERIVRGARITGHKIRESTCQLSHGVWREWVSCHDIQYMATHAWSVSKCVLEDEREPQIRSQDTPKWLHMPTPNHSAKTDHARVLYATRTTLHAYPYYAQKEPRKFKGGVRAAKCS